MAEDGVQTFLSLVEMLNLRNIQLGKDNMALGLTNAEVIAKNIMLQSEIIRLQQDNRQLQCQNHALKEQLEATQTDGLTAPSPPEPQAISPESQAV